MILTNIAVKQAKPQDKNFKLSDAGGLFLLVKPNGGKYWRLKYRYAGKEKLLALGVYPETKLVRARELAAEAKQRLRNGIDPGEAATETRAELDPQTGPDIYDIAADGGSAIRQPNALIDACSVASVGKFDEAEASR